MEIPKTDKKRILVIGAGFGGIAFAQKMAKSNYQIVMVDKNNFHLFQPLMYQVATSALEADSITYPIRKIFQKQKNFFFRLGEVENVDTKEKLVWINGKSISYDYLVIASGAKTNFFGNEGLSVSAMAMKSVRESLDLRSLILQNFEKALWIKNKRKRQGLLNFVIAGAGPTGVELAGAIGEFKQNILAKDYPELDSRLMNVFLVHSRDRVLPMLSEKSSAKALKYLKELGVEVVLNTRVLDFHGDYVQTNTDDDIIAKTLIWTAGVEGNPVIGMPKNSVNKGNRLEINEYCQVAGLDDVFAIGDVASMSQNIYPKGHPMIAPAAMQQGVYLANYFKKNFKLKPFEYKDKGAMATIGKNRAVVEIGNRKMAGIFAWFIWMVVHLLSLVGFRNKTVALLNWVKNYFSSDKSVRVILLEFDLLEEKKRRKKEMNLSDNV
jgi:NADH:ubiquinone reductase (H+-translocating)